jgi:hypothetical protein
VFRFGDDYVLHGIAGIGALGVLVVKVAVVRSGVGGRFLPVLGITLFTLLAVTWLTVVPGFLAGED